MGNEAEQRARVQEFLKLEGNLAINEIDWFSAGLSHVVHGEFGSIHAASETLGFPFETLRKWCKGESARVRASSLKALVSGLERYYKGKADGLRLRLRRGGLSSTERERLLLQYEDARIGALQYIYRLLGRVLGQTGRRRLSRYERWKARQLRRFASDRGKRADDLLKKLDEKFVGRMSGLRSALLAAGHEPDRVKLALYRIIEPLLDASSSGGVERDFGGWIVGSHSKLRRFLDQGIARERLVLERPAAFKRATAPAT